MMSKSLERILTGILLLVMDYSDKVFLRVSFNYIQNFLVNVREIMK